MTAMLFPIKLPVVIQVPAFSFRLQCRATGPLSEAALCSVCHTCPPSVNL